MDPLQDPGPPRGGPGLAAFVEQVNRLQEANLRLEARIAERVLRTGSQGRDWSRQERVVEDLRTQVHQLLLENLGTVLQTRDVRARAGAIWTRCEVEERSTRRLEQQVALLRESGRRAEEGWQVLRAEWRRLEEAQREAQRELQAVWALQLQQADSCDALSVTAAAAAGAQQEQQEQQEDGTWMELSQLLHQIRAQQDQTRPPPPPGAGGWVGPGRSGPALRGAAEEEAAWTQVNLGGSALREARAELAEARKQWHSLQVEMETLHALEKGLETSLQHTQQVYSTQLLHLSQVTAGLEAELQQVRSGLSSQRQRHAHLLNTRMRLEREISTYRRLLEREEGRYAGQHGEPGGARVWRSPAPETREDGEEDGLSDAAVTPDEPTSEPLPERAASGGGLKRGALRRQQSLVVLTEPDRDQDLPISTVKTQEILQGNVVRESAEAHGTIETEKVDQVIRQWEGSFFRGNPRLRRKSVSLRFDLHMAAADEGCAQTGPDSLPDVELRLIMKRSRSISAIAQ